MRQQAEREVRIVADAAALARAAAEEFLRCSQEAVKSAGRFAVALSGGSTPKAMFKLLAWEFREQVPWSAVHLFWGDERHVPPDHADSNFRMTREALLDLVNVPETNVHRIHAEQEQAADAASAYADELRSFFKLVAGQWPRFDLVMLGMGPDGHCASLFPGTFAVREKDNLVVAPWVDKFSTYRITLSPPALNNGKQVMFLVAGPDKAETLQHVLEGKRETDRYPSQVIQPANGKLVWMVDRAAASRLASS